MNFEVRYSIDLILTKIARAKRIHHSSFDIRHSTFQCSFIRGERMRVQGLRSDLCHLFSVI
ncbi:hypothetical protein D1AOALGA4SA_183 [Olavius algarvensis Delta 1 endosymbiont]|nr:hypothetical protein D1AOALGA4SA_183 [Olavius algarvensis Delta 1 endosymbiont]